MHVEAILQTKGGTVHTVRSTELIATAIAVLNQRRIGAVVVVDDAGHVAGILSERDIVRRMGSDPNSFLSTPISQSMTRAVVTCTRQTSLDEVLEMMTERRIRHMPVVEGESLVGIISIGDVVKRKIELTEQEAAALRDYIAS
ncbi:CBS domain-containing protein [Devosia enhydra]|uniref:CBS domain-containing protein n=1 Tax=Devosia enhydra TaxID=665118 RepID=A0A1K2HVC7_9HYPH|nr:CBS domain-containing protein [Devosia enhydra]SFZ82293.1 CBS domain-containing protein [Devosia enhydra]